MPSLKISSSINDIYSYVILNYGTKKNGRVFEFIKGK